jgi:tRNA nucleotidyltransferase (CCA-adding enzyme)
LEIAEKNGVLRVILPELPSGGSANAFARVERLDTDGVLRLSALLADVEFPALEPILRRLTMSNEDRHRILAALRLHTDFALAGDDERSLRTHLSAVGRSAAQDHLQILLAEAEHLSDTGSQRKVQRAREVLQSGVALEVGDLAMNGGQVMKLTGAKGRLVGDILRGLLARVLGDPTLNSPEALAALAIDLSNAHPE